MSRESRRPARRATGDPVPRHRRDEDLRPVAGYRATRRTSKAGRAARVDRQRERVRVRVGTGARFARDATVRAMLAVLVIVVSFAVVIGVLWGFIAGVNSLARWSATKKAAEAVLPKARKELARDNLLVIGVKDRRAMGFMAVRIDGKEKRVFGIAVPEGAFMEVPGQGFERIGDSYASGPKVSMAAVSNYLTIPFEHYVVVDASVYTAALTGQSLKGVLEAATASDHTRTKLRSLESVLDGISGKNVAIVPLPVKPITIADQTYYEPQRKEVADLLFTWWGVRLSASETRTRVILYNGTGTPGIAGTAAQALIKAGYVVVDTKNADRFDYAKTLIVLQHTGAEWPAKGAAVRKTLRVGTVTTQESDQDVADIIIIIGKDYAPASGG
ncbi:MAG: LytR C-terminal domain-containing protein [Coriobacteriia bacterium]